MSQQTEEDRVKRVGLETLAGGAAIEAFNHELQRVLDNIVDPNATEGATREITLKVKIKPDPKKATELGQVSIICNSKLAPIEPVSTFIYFGVERGKGIATEFNPKQPSLPFGGNVTPITKGTTKVPVTVEGAQ